MWARVRVLTLLSPKRTLLTYESSHLTKWLSRFLVNNKIARSKFATTKIIMYTCNKLNKRATDISNKHKDNNHNRAEVQVTYHCHCWNSLKRQPSNLDVSSSLLEHSCHQHSSCQHRFVRWCGWHSCCGHRLDRLCHRQHLHLSQPAPCPPQF